MARRGRTMTMAGLTLLMLAVLLPPTAARGVEQVGTTFPADFTVILDASLGVRVIGFGAAGRVKHTPVIFLHGNNDTPFPTACNPFGYIHAMARFFADHGYATSELWGLGYQGDQCDLGANPTNRSAGATPRWRTFPTFAASCTPCSTTPAHGRSTSSATAWASRSPARGCAPTTRFTWSAASWRSMAPTTASSTVRRRRRTSISSRTRGASRPTAPSAWSTARRTRRCSGS
jgi:hypothetical protein